MLLETRVQILEEVLSAALVEGGSKDRERIKYRLRARMMGASCGDGSFDRKQIAEYNDILEQAVQFTEFGVYLRD